MKIVETRTKQYDLGLRSLVLTKSAVIPDFPYQFSGLLRQNSEIQTTQDPPQGVHDADCRNLGTLPFSCFILIVMRVSMSKQ